MFVFVFVYVLGLVVDSCEFVVILLFIVLIFFYFLDKSFNISYNQVQEAQRPKKSPKEVGPKEKRSRHIIITLPKIKDKERILTAAREKETAAYKGVPIRL